MCLRFVGTASLDLSPAKRLSCEHDWAPPGPDGRFLGRPEKWHIPMARCVHCGSEYPLSYQRWDYERWDYE